MPFFFFRFFALFSFVFRFCFCVISFLTVIFLSSLFCFFLISFCYGYRRCPTKLICDVTACHIFSNGILRPPGCHFSQTFCLAGNVDLCHKISTELTPTTITNPLRPGSGVTARLLGFSALQDFRVWRVQYCYPNGNKNLPFLPYAFFA